MKRLILPLFVIILVAAVAPAAAAQAVRKPAQPPLVIETYPPPAAVVRELYRVHRNGYGPLFEKRGRRQHEKFFDAKLAALIWRDLTEGPEDEVGRISFDPLFNAQDMKIKNLRVGAGKVSGDAATVPVTFVNYDQRVRIDFRLVRTESGWKISNIVYGDGVDFLKILSEPL